MAEEALYLVLSGLLRASLAPGTPSSSRGVQKLIVRVPQSTSALTDLGGGAIPAFHKREAEASGMRPLAGFAEVAATRVEVVSFFFRPLPIRS